MHSKWSNSRERNVIFNQPGIEATVSTWKVIKFQFNSALWFIVWMPNQAHRQKKILRAAFACRYSLMAPCKMTQYYDQATVALDF